VKITIVEKGSTFKTANPEVKVLFNMEQGPPAIKDDVEGAAAVAGFPLEQVDEADSADEVSKAKKASSDVKKTKIGTSPVDAVEPGLAAKDLVARFKAARAQAQAYKTQALVLGKHLKKSSARVFKAQATSRVLSVKYRAEKVKRMELQNMILQLIGDREADVDDCDDVDLPDIDAPQANTQQRVIVLGASESPTATLTEMAGEVVVVRPSAALDRAGTPPPARRARRSSTVTIKSVAKSVKRVSVGGDVVRVLVDNVEVPQWIFDQEFLETPTK
jgi:hypothetical protein